MKPPVLRIGIVPVKLPKQHPTKLVCSFIELHPTHLRYKFRFMANEPTDDEDLSLPWKEFNNSFEGIVLKQFIAHVEKLITVDSIWKVYVSAEGVGKDIALFFDREETATEVYRRITAWLLDPNFSYQLTL